MKLSEIETKQKIPTVGPGEASVRLRSEPGAGVTAGWSLDYEAGIVTASKGDVELLIPVANIAYMRRYVAPVVEAKKPVRAA